MRILRSMCLMTVVVLLAACRPGSVPTEPVVPIVPDTADQRPSIRSLFFGEFAYSTGAPQGKWLNFTGAAFALPLVVVHVPCVSQSFNETRVPTLVGVLVTGDTVRMPAANFDWMSSDTSVLAFADSRKDSFTATYKRVGVVTVSATYRDGMMVSQKHEVIARDPGPGSCVR